MSLAADVNMLRTTRAHLEAQVEAGVDTSHATLEEATEALRGVHEELRALEAEALHVPGLAYLFRKTRRRGAGRTHVLSPKYATSNVPTSTEDSMARKSKEAQLEEVLAELRAVEKRAGSTKWALSGAGAAKNPPSKGRKAHLKAKLEAEQAQIAELRAKRDALKA